ncbi:homoserine O-acetyltransferase [Sphingobacterium shayense]|uniref:homoserine O-acetyltransferase family protein n=1 Tax=Sphingobacterium shayense TaxID=626343 RepID=UPI00155304F6|nr:homoserine O-acetyltransferase [Sphingobacterium shayense]NQD70343.1 homoserine O-acetyltransferase [Sphingobacterium shayense]
MGLKHIKSTKDFILENGECIGELTIAYHTFGELNAEKDNVVWVCHPLTANSDVFDWWPGLFGENELFNHTEHFIVCANVLGSSYGTTSPLSNNPKTGCPYYLTFPQFTIRDIVRVNQVLAEHLGIQKIATLIGGSLGGQQALEWTTAATIPIERLIVIGCSAQASPWAIAFNESQRMAIQSDSSFYDSSDTGGMEGLKTARSIALLSYRNYHTYSKTQEESDTNITDNYKASSYQQYQGLKLGRRFNAYSYWYLTKAMDSHHLSRNRISISHTLSQIEADTLVIGTPSDLLFPSHEQEYIASQIPNAAYYELNSTYGHDSFLIETKTLAEVIGNFLEKSSIQPEELLQIE